MKKHSRNTMWSLAWVWLVVLFWGMAHASAPNWSVITYPFYTGVMARVYINGEPVRAEGSKLAAFQGDEVRGVAEIRGANQAENIDGEYYFNLMFGSEDANEKNFTFKLWNSADDQVYNLDKELDFDVNYPQKPSIYGGFANGAFVPCVMNNIDDDRKYQINITNGTATVNGVRVTEASPGDVVTITANPPSSSQGLRIWNAGGVSEFTGSILGPTTTFVMPRNDVTLTPSFVAKSSMPAVAVRSTTNAGDDTATEPAVGATASDKGKFTFTRTTSSGALTVCFSIRGTATNGVDYKSIQSSVTFASGKTSVSIDIEPLADGVYEGDETVTVVLEPDPSAPSQTYRGGTVTDATVTIIDIDNPIDDIAMVQYTLYPAAAVAAGAKWRIDNGDWIDSGETVTTTGGSHTITFKDVAGYTTPEPQILDLPVDTQTFTNASATYEETTPGPVEHTLTVTGGKINLNGVMVSSAQFTPGDIVTITATIPSSTQGLKIWTPDQDVEFIGSVLGATTTIKMPAHDVTIAASFVTKSSMPAVSVRSTTNTGDDTAKEPASTTAAADNKGKFTFTRTSVNQSKALTVYFSLRGTAANGVDYKSIQSSVTFAANSTSASVEIEPLFDGIDEGDETVEVVLEAEQGTQTYRGGTYTDASITIEDTPVPGPVVNGTIKYTLVSDAGTTVAGAQWKIDDGNWNNSDTAVTASAGSHTITFKDVANYTTPASQTVTVSEGAETQGTAIYIYNPAPVDYLLKLTGGKIDGTGATEGRYVPGDLVIITATLPTNQGLKIWTPDQDVEFIGSVLGTTTTIRMPAHDVTIAASFVTKSSMPAVSVRSTTNTGDDDAKEPSSATAAADNKGKFTFTRTSVNQSKALTVYYSIRGTAENGVDYKSIQSSVTFAANSTSASVEIEPLYDDILEDYETVEVVLDPAPGTQTYRGGTYTDALITIENSGGGIAPVYSTVKYTLLSDTGTPVEGAQWKIDNGDWNDSDTAVTASVGSHTIYFKDVTNYTTPASQTVTVAEGAETQGTAMYIYNPVPVQYTLTLTGGTINGTSSKTGTFYPGDIVTITANPSSTSQALKVWTPSNDVEFIGSVLGATTTIKMPAYDVTIAASFVTKSSMPAVSVRSTTNTGDDTAKEPSSATAAADKGKFTFTRTTVNQSRALTVYYSVRGTAANGVDYKSIQSSVTFAANSTSASVEIEPLFDGIDEGDETVEVVLEAEQGTQTYRGGTYTDASITIEDTPVPGPDAPYHPADCVVQDYIISGTEYLQYVGPVKAVALSNKEYEWDGENLLSIAAKTSQSSAPQTRGGDIAIERTVSPAVYSAGSTVVVTLTINGADKMANLFIGEKIPAGWTVLGNAASNVVNGVLKMTWDSPSIPATYSYSIKAPTSNLADSYVIASSADDTACFTDGMEFIHIADTALLNSSNNYLYHPADCVNKDKRISGIEYLMYAGPVQALALANEAYTWDGVDVLSIRKKNATRGGAADDVAIVRSVDKTTYEAGGQVAVTLSISGADSMVSLFIGEQIPDGWSVVGDYSANFKNGVLRMTWDAPNIPETVTYILQAPEKDLAPVCRIATSTVDTGCFTDRVVFLKTEDTFLTLDTDLKPAEWPQDLKLYTPADGRNFRANDKIAVAFSWPAILNADSYRLVIATYDGAIVFDEIITETVCTVNGLACGSFIWNVTAIGDDCVAGCTDDFLFAVVQDVPAPIISGASADGTTVRLAFDTADSGYKDGVFAYQMVFFSMKTCSWISLTENLPITNGQAVIDLGVDASNGYLYICPATTPESDFVELYIK